MARIIAKYNAGVVIMHMQGIPRSMQKKPCYSCLIGEVILYLNDAIKKGLDNGIKRESIIIDPGIGFGKTLEHNLEILNKLSEFKTLGQPILVGTSRKSFIGKILGTQVRNQICGTIASCIVACENGANILRVHDVAQVKEALLVRDEIKRWN